MNKREVNKSKKVVVISVCVYPEELEKINFCVNEFNYRSRSQFLIQLALKEYRVYKKNV
jgi:hypothetical protein